MKHATIKILRTVLCAVALGLAGVPAMAQDEAAAREEMERSLAEAREQIREAAEQIARLSVELSEEPIMKWMERIELDSDKPVLGVHIQSVDGSAGVGVAGVTPDGPADKAGIESGDQILAIDGQDLSGATGGEALQKLMEFMETVETGQTVQVTVERDGRRQTFPVTCEPLGDHAMSFSFSGSPDFHFEFDDGHAERWAELGERFSEQSNAFVFDFRAGPWSDMEVVELTPELGAYFGVSEGLLIVRAPEDDDVDLRDGDVILALGGDKLTTPRDLTGALRKLEDGDVAQFDIVRQRRSVTLDARVPDGGGRNVLKPIVRKRTVVIGKDSD